MCTFAILVYVLHLAVSSECLQPYFLPIQTRQRVTLPNADTGEPLFLTEFIKSGKISEARKQSEVSLVKQVKGNAGFLTVDERLNSNIYFWFCKKTNTNWAKAPLILWLQGGPGCSSISSLFVENGPFLVRKSVLKRRKYAWTERYNVLYIDQPVGTGFSFTDQEEGYSSSQEAVAKHLYEALRQFYKLFPELQHNDFYITGQSYAGKYIPAIGHMIHHRNLESNSTKIPLNGMFIGNAWSDPVNMLGYAEYVHNLGLIDQEKKREMETIQEQLVALVQSKSWLKAEEQTRELLSAMYVAAELDCLSDYTQDGYHYDASFIEYLESDKVRKSIHVGPRVFELCSQKVYEHMKSDLMKSVKPWIEELLEHYSIVFYNGQLDIIAAYPLTVNFLKKLHWSAAYAYSIAERRVWRVEEHVAGYYKSAGNLVEVLVRNAGHSAVADQPKYTLDLLDKFVEGKLK